MNQGNSYLDLRRRQAVHAKAIRRRLAAGLVAPFSKDFDAIPLNGGRNDREMMEYGAAPVDFREGKRGQGSGVSPVFT